MRTLTGGTAIVTGSTSAFAGAGADFVLNGFGAPADIEKERAAIETAFKVKGLYLPADTSKPVEIAEMLALGEKSLGSVDILLNNAGFQFVSPVEEFPIGKWDAIIAINLSLVFTASVPPYPAMKKRGWGRIINTVWAHWLVASPFKFDLCLGEARSPRADEDRCPRTRDVQDQLQLHQPRLCLDTACGAPDFTDTAQHDWRAGHKECASRRAADQGARHLRASRRTRAVPLQRRCRTDHERQPVHRRRLDGGLRRRTVFSSIWRF
jgi:short chain dehydrogenase